MSDYILGGWTQSLSAQAARSYSYVIYGMVTDLQNLKTGGGWGPGDTSPPTNYGKVMWAYGGEGAWPSGMPATESDNENIIQATESKNWDGVDFDDESDMNVGNLVATMSSLGDRHREKSYTFLAGWDYNHPEHSQGGMIINNKVKEIANENVCDRFVMMCYGGGMWSMDEIKANVPYAVRRTVDYVRDSKKVILALTHAGLTINNLEYFLNEVTSNNLGGLFVWEFPSLNPEHLTKIESELDLERTTTV